ncbi:MAG: hypothetical protein IPL97_13930 [Niastella sp.]|nr:hypothetical protein [Niastella sp.]
MQFLKDKKFIYFVIKFLLLFAIFYYGTLAMIGLAAPVGYHSPFVEKYLDYVSWLKYSLMYATKGILWIGGVDTVFAPDYVIRIVNGRGVKIAMDCVGYGVYSFWAAYVIANDGTMKRKMIWVLGGIFLLWLINSLRISLFLLSVDGGWPMPLGLDHHTWFNIFAYLAIFTLIYFFEKRGKIT